MSTKVVKFGGSSLADAEQFKKVADIVLSDPTRRYVVASAPGKRFSGDVKVTDMLYNCYSLAVQGESFAASFESIEQRFNRSEETRLNSSHTYQSRMPSSA